LEKTDKLVGELHVQVDSNVENLSEEIMSREKGEVNLDKKIDNEVEKETVERKKDEELLEEKRAGKEMLMMKMTKQDCKEAIEIAKRDVHELKLSTEANLAEKYEELLKSAKTMDEELYSTAKSDMTSSLTVSKAYSDTVVNSKNEYLGTLVEEVRRNLSEQVDNVRAGLHSETESRGRIMDSVNETFLNERRKTDSEFTVLGVKLNEDGQFAEKERTQLKNLIESRSQKAEEKLGQRILAEAHTLRR